MYEVLSYWEFAPSDESAPDYIREWAEMWRGTEKVVFSRTLDAVSTARTRIERRFDAEAITALKTEASRDLTVAGPDLAGQAIEFGLVEELQVFTVPLIVGGGKPWLPTGVRLRLSLIESHSFANGFTFHRYGLA
jgi:dihydrofolate reductase